jgi:hypothetical protein
MVSNKIVELFFSVKVYATTSSWYSLSQFQYDNDHIDSEKCCSESRYTQVIVYSKISYSLTDVTNRVQDVRIGLGQR